jgi:hypothetical protein
VSAWPLLEMRWRIDWCEISLRGDISHQPASHQFDVDPTHEFWFNLIVMNIPLKNILVVACMAAFGAALVTPALAGRGDPPPPVDPPKPPVSAGTGNWHAAALNLTSCPP